MFLCVRSNLAEKVRQSIIKKKYKKLKNKKNKDALRNYVIQRLFRQGNIFIEKPEEIILIAGLNYRCVIFLMISINIISQQVCEIVWKNTYIPHF